MENTTLTPSTSNSEIVIYQPDDIIRLEVRMHEETLWLTQQQMAVLFGCSSDNIGLHLKNLFSEQEINRDSTTEFFSVVRLEGNRTVRRNVMHYNLDAILSVGYRVSSRNATLFRFSYELFRKRRRNKDVLCHCYLLHFRDKALVFAIVDFFRFVLGLFLKFEFYAHLLKSFEDFVL